MALFISVIFPTLLEPLCPEGSRFYLGKIQISIAYECLGGRLACERWFSLGYSDADRHSISGFVGIATVSWIEESTNHHFFQYVGRISRSHHSSKDVIQIHNYLHSLLV